MGYSVLKMIYEEDKLFLDISGEFTLHSVSNYEKQVSTLNLSTITTLVINIDRLTYLDTAAAIFLNGISIKFEADNIKVSIVSKNSDFLDTINLIKEQKKLSQKLPIVTNKPFLKKLGLLSYSQYIGFLSFLAFLGELFATKLHYLKSINNIRFKEIAFEINESAIKAIGIIALTSFLIGLVVAYQSAFQLKIYGANIFIVDMLGISILRELAPLITAIVIAGRSGSAFTAQIGAMKITEELDAMRTMGFDPYVFLVLPRIIALMIAMPLLIFLADIMGIIGGMVVANIDLGITTDLFLDRFIEVIAIKHFYIGILKGPFFAFLIAAIGIYRGLKVKDDTQSIGINTTKSVVESIFAVIVCDAIFSIIFTNLGI